MSSNPRLFYFRHGETDWSLSGRHTGVTDIALTPRGERQARALRPWTAAISFTHVFTSPRLRARTTCELAGLGAQAKIEPDLAEWSYGDYEGRRSADICKDRPSWNIFRDGCPNGESAKEIGARADRLIARLRELNGDIALFAHGQLGSVFVARWIGLAPVEGGHFRNWSGVHGRLGLGSRPSADPGCRALEHRAGLSGVTRAPPFSRR